jgi:hypothetical protein
MATPVFVPAMVLQALDVVDHEVPDDVFDPDTLMTFVHLFGFDEAELWLREHRDCCFEAMRIVREHTNASASQATAAANLNPFASLTDRPAFR